MANGNYGQLSEALEWVNKVVDYFSPYKPETKSMTINYRNLNAEIELLLFIPDNMKRKLRMVEIPAYQNFIVSEMRDESFNRIGEMWSSEDGKWKLNASNLPPSEKYLLTLRGTIPKEALSKVVFVQPSANRDQTEDMDRYWLSSMIRNVDALQKLWDALEVDDVTAKVNVGIERCFSTTLPKELKEQINANRRWTKAGYRKDREEVNRAWSDLRRSKEKFKCSIGDLVNMIQRLTADNTFSKFLHLDEPYSIGEIRREEGFKGTFPDRMYTEAVTSLSLKQPTAKGYLSFKKKDYTEAIRSEFEKLS